MPKKTKHAGGRPPLPEESRRVQLTVSLPPRMVERLKKDAQGSKITVSAVVEAALWKRFAERYGDGIA